LYPPGSGAAAVDEYAVIHEEKTVTRFLRAPPVGKDPAVFIFPLGVIREEFLKSFITVAMLFMAFTS
jgi:hypothetical protein